MTSIINDAVAIEQALKYYAMIHWTELEMRAVRKYLFLQLGFYNLLRKFEELIVIKIVCSKQQRETILKIMVCQEMPFYPTCQNKILRIKGRINLLQLFHGQIIMMQINELYPIDTSQGYRIRVISNLICRHCFNEALYPRITLHCTH